MVCHMIKRVGIGCGKDGWKKLISAWVVQALMVSAMADLIRNKVGDTEGKEGGQNEGAEGLWTEDRGMGLEGEGEGEEASASEGASYPQQPLQHPRCDEVSSAGDGGGGAGVGGRGGGRGCGDAEREVEGRVGGGSGGCGDVEVCHMLIGNECDDGGG